MASKQRQYECVVFGATGYTGKYTAEHITTAFPTDFAWAVAGRSEGKLRAVVDDLEKLHANRKAPAIEIAALNKADLVALAKKTKVLVSTVGPYHKYGTTAFEACAETGTHYLDVTGEGPWVYDMIQRFHTKAKQTGAIMIPQTGVESAPADMMAWMLASEIRNTLGVGTGEVITSVHTLKGAPSGGTLTTALTLFDTYSLGELVKKNKPWSICPVTPPKQDHVKSLFERLTGLRRVSDLGLLTTSIQADADKPIVQRSWGLHNNGKLYGPGFSISGYMRASSALMGVAIHLVSTFGLLLLVVPPVRWLLLRLVYKAGEGPTKESTKDDVVEWRAVADAQTSDPSDPKRAFCRMRWDGSMYYLTGILLAEGAYTLAREKTYAHELGGGVLTSSTMGEAYLRRLNAAGLKTEVKLLP